MYGSWLLSLALIIVLICILILWTLKKYNLIRILKLSKQFDGPPAQWLIGNAAQFMLRSTAERYRMCLHLVVGYKSPSRYWEGTTLTTLIRDVSDCEKLLSSTQILDKSNHYNYFKPWLCEGLLTSTGKKWHKRRKILTPAFHFKILKQYVKIMNKNSKILVDCLGKNFQPNEKCDILNLLSMCALDIICETSMGISINAMKYQNSKYIQAVKSMTELMQKRMFSLFLRFNFIFRFTKEYQNQQKYLKTLHGFTEQVIKDRREEIQKNGVSIYDNDDNDNYDENLVKHGSDTNNDIGIKRKMAFLDILLLSTDDDGKKLTDLDIREEVDTFMFEGHDTVTTALIFLFYHIAKYRDVQEKCFKEASSLVLDNFKTPITINTLNQMNYSEMVIKESLRLFPPVSAFGRTIKKECTINGITYPAECSIALMPYAMHRTERLYPNATSFIPERFSENSNLKPNNPFAYLPFSAGPRNCIGQKFAMLEMKSILLHTILNYEFILDIDCYAEPELKAEVVVSPVQPIYFYLKPRNLEK